MTNCIKEYLQYAKKIISLVENNPDCHIFTHTAEGRLELINETQRLEEIQRLNKIKKLEKELEILKERKYLKGILNLFKRTKNSEEIKILEEKLKLLNETKRLEDIKRLSEIKHLEEKLDFLKKINFSPETQRFEKIEHLEKLKSLESRLEILKAIDCLEANPSTQISSEDENRLLRMIQPLHNTLIQLSRDQEKFEPGKANIKNRIDSIKKVIKSIDEKQVKELSKAVKDALEVCEYSMDRGINRWDIDTLEGPLLIVENFLASVNIEVNAVVADDTIKTTSYLTIIKGLAYKLPSPKIHPKETLEQQNYISTEDTILEDNQAFIIPPNASLIAFPGRTIYNIPKDGNCFYSAIGINLGLTATNIRDMAIQHVMHQHEYYENILPMRVIDFVAENRPLGIWAGHEMIQITANHFNLHVIIVEEGTLIEYPSITPATGINQYTQEIRLIYTEERTHYVTALANDHPILQANQVQEFSLGTQLSNAETIPLLLTTLGDLPHGSTFDWQ